jgi:hypothetical protein
MRMNRVRGVIVATTAVLAAVVLAVAIARAPEQLVTPSATPISAVASPTANATPTATATATATASPTAAALPTALPTPVVASPTAFATIAPSQLDTFVPAQTRGIGQLSGDWVFLLRRSTLFGTLPHPPLGERVVATDHAVDSLTLVPIAGPESRTVMVATFLSDLGNGIVATNQVGAQLSPGGDRLVLAVGVKGPQGGERLGLVVIDLASGNMFNLTTDASYHDDTPAWSPDGRWIAFSRRTVKDGRDAAVWIVGSTPGSQARALMSPQVHEPGRRTYIYGWTPDGRLLAMTRGHLGIEFTDPFFVGVCPLPAPVCVPPPMTSFNGSVSGSRDVLDWRARTPQFIAAFAEQPNGSGATPTIAVANGPATSLRTVARSSASSGGSLLRPRWRPGSDEALYEDSPARSGAGGHKVNIVDTSSGVSRQVIAQPSPMFAEWTPDGSSIAWVEAIGVAFAVRVVAADGSRERVIHSGGGVPEAQVITVDFGTLRF